MHLSLQMDQLQHYRFLSGSAGPGPSRTMMEGGDGRSHQKDSKLPVKGQNKISAISSEVKFAYRGPSQGPMYHGRRKPTEPVPLAMLAAGACISALRASEHTHWSYAPHSPLLQLVDWMAPAPITFPND